MGWNPGHTTKHLHSGTFVFNCVMFMFQSRGLGNNVFSIVSLSLNDDGLLKNISPPFNHPKDFSPPPPPRTAAPIPLPMQKSWSPFAYGENSGPPLAFEKKIRSPLFHHQKYTGPPFPFLKYSGTPPSANRWPPVGKMITPQ